MTKPNHEIGSGLPPHAAEVEPPAAVVHAGGSATAVLHDARARAHAVLESVEWQMSNHLPAKGETGKPCYERRLVQTIAEALEEALAASEGDVGMGVTGNAILLLGNVASQLIGAPDRLYEVEQIDAGAGTLLIRRRGTENIHRISIVQLEGCE